MKFKILKWVGIILSVALTTAYSADPEYWQEYEARGVLLMQHIQDLSTVSDKDSVMVKDRKKNALAYFFATGGKYGFREEAPTPFEYEILVRALAVATALHYESGSDFNLEQVRKKYRSTTDDATANAFLTHMQAIINTVTFKPYEDQEDQEESGLRAFIPDIF